MHGVRIAGIPNHLDRPGPAKLQPQSTEHSKRSLTEPTQKAIGLRSYSGSATSTAFSAVKDLLQSEEECSPGLVLAGCVSVWGEVYQCLREY